MPAKKLTKSDRVRRILKSAMCAQGLTQQKVAKRFKVSQGTISSWLSGYDHMNVGDFELLCRYLNLKPSEVLECE